MVNVTLLPTLASAGPPSSDRQIATATARRRRRRVRRGRVERGRGRHAVFGVAPARQQRRRELQRRHRPVGHRPIATPGRPRNLRSTASPKRTHTARSRSATAPVAVLGPVLVHVMVNVTLLRRSRRLVHRLLDRQIGHRHRHRRRRRRVSAWSGRTWSRSPPPCWRSSRSPAPCRELQRRTAPLVIVRSSTPGPAT